MCHQAFPYHPAWTICLVGLCTLVACRNSPTKSDVTAVVEIAAETFSTYAGGEIQLQATAITEDGSTQKVTEEALWRILPGAAGTISQTGLLTTIVGVTGTETVQAEFGAQTASVEITVTERAQDFITYPAVLNIRAGKEMQFSGVAWFLSRPVFDPDGIKWSVSDGQEYAEMADNGLLQAKANVPGDVTVTVTAEYHKFSSTSRVTIQPIYESRFELVQLPASTFTMGDNNGDRQDGPEHNVSLDAFRIGKYEITNEKYVSFLNSALARGEVVYSDGAVLVKNGPFRWQRLVILRAIESEYIVEEEPEYIIFDETGEFSVASGYVNHPVTRLTYFGAATFCFFYGFRLPSEAEWEAACRAEQGLEFGTLNGTLNHDLANYAGTGGRDRYESMAPVGSFPANPIGLFDMSGNVYEFVNDAFARDYYSVSPAVNPSGPGYQLPVGPTYFGTVVRGGSSNSTSGNCRAASREGYNSVALYGDGYGGVPYNFITRTGFRVAR